MNEANRGYFITGDCVGCTLCAKVCPANAITGALKTRHVIDENRCIRCGACGRVCAKDAILDEKRRKTGRVGKKDQLHPAVNVAMCVGCSVCIENCPKGCLKLTEPAYHGDIHTVAALVKPEACIGCGLCADHCPIRVIKMVKPGEPDSFAEYKGGKKMGLYQAYCRVYQAVFKVGNYFLGYRTPETIEGAGSVKRMPELLRAAKSTHTLIVTDPNILKLNLMAGMLEALDAAKLPYTVFSDIGPNPTSDMVEAGLKVYHDNGCDAIVAFGGGSPMDCAKAIGARVARPKKSVVRLQGVLTVLKRIPPFFAVPTTAGTGSETTLAAVITDAKTHHKAAIMDPNLIPKQVILDPEVTIGLPPFVTATTGMDALSHAVEAYTNHTYNTPLENTYAKEAVKLIFDNLYTAYSDGKNIEARQNMQIAAFKAGRAFTRGCVGYVHAVGHTVSGLHNIPHGLAMSVILPHVMRQFGEAAHKRLAELADVCGIEGANAAEKANKFIDRIDALNRSMNIPANLDMIEDRDVEQMVKWAMQEGNPLYPVPAIWGEDEFKTLIHTIRTAK